VMERHVSENDAKEDVIYVVKHVVQKKKLRNV